MAAAVAAAPLKSSPKGVVVVVCPMEMMPDRASVSKGEVRYNQPLTLRRHRVPLDHHVTSCSGLSCEGKGRIDSLVPYEVAFRSSVEMMYNLQVLGELSIFGTGSRLCCIRFPKVH
eukprot:GHVS01094894.1.p2 GENE.GHVS01094894.1~~GHVS01094894.1.p2  ORF type:complete len:116 (-),score=7.01 GHVS01094894.1:152-499(-)